MIVINKTDASLSVRGHAAGRDVKPSAETMQACAAVTAVVQTTLFGIIELVGDHPNYVLAKGCFVLELSGLSEKSMLLVDTFLIGVSRMAEVYPECINIVQA